MVAECPTVTSSSTIVGNSSPRDTGIFEATKGLAEVNIWRAVGETAFSVNHSSRFLFFFISQGRLKLSDDKGEIYHLEKGACFALPKNSQYLIEAESGLEMIRVSLP